MIINSMWSFLIYRLGKAAVNGDDNNTKLHYICKTMLVNVRPLGKIVFGNMPQFLCLTSNFLNRGIKLLERGIHQIYYFLLHKE